MKDSPENTVCEPPAADGLGFFWPHLKGASRKVWPIGGCSTTAGASAFGTGCSSGSVFLDRAEPGRPRDGGVLPTAGGLLLWLGGDSE